MAKAMKEMSFEEVMEQRKKLNSEQLIETDETYNARIYSSLPVVIAKGEGMHVWDSEGKKYYDFLACFGAVNQGHRHPKIVEAVKQQMDSITLCSRAYYSDMLALYSKFVTNFFGYDRMLPMNTGVEAAETAVKLARKWGYVKKGIADSQAKVVFVEGNFWGRSISAVSSSTCETTYKDFGPYVGGFVIVPYDDIPALRTVLEREGSTVAGLMVEPLQGEAGCFMPSHGYLRMAKDLCEKHNVLFIADEIQSGLGRTGRLLCCDYEDVRPDILVLGKALSGGVTPVSCVLADDPIMLTMGRGTHGSTYGGNAMGCAAAIAALCVLRDEKLAENAFEMGKLFREKLMSLKDELPWVCAVRGLGLMNAIEVASDHVKAWDVCLELMRHGILAKPTHSINIRFTPPLCITKEQVEETTEVIRKVFKSFHK